jgi:hypothetical protein
MRVTRHTATELVLEDSCIWIAGVLAIVSLPFFYAGVLADSKTGYYATGALFLLLALPATRKSRFVFDARERVVRWRNFLIFRTSVGNLAFDDIRGIEIESFSSEGNSFTYRLTILTSDKPVPLSSAYRPGKEKHTNLKKTIATFLNLEIGSQESTMDVDPSVVELVRAGRKVAAIELLRSMKKMSLLDAKRIVDEIESGSPMKP